MPVSPPDFKMCFAVMEVEAWFLQEEVHFGRISPALTWQAVVMASGFDWTQDCAELIRWPARTLNEIYRIAGLRYDKRRRRVERTVQAIDYANLYLSKRGILGSFDRFVSEVDSFLT